MPARELSDCTDPQAPTCPRRSCAPGRSSCLLPMLCAWPTSPQSQDSRSRVSHPPSKLQQKNDASPCQLPKDAKPPADSGCTHQGRSPQHAPLQSLPPPTRPSMPPCTLGGSLASSCRYRLVLAAGAAGEVAAAGGAAAPGCETLYCSPVPQDPAFLREAVLGAIAPQRLTAADLAAAGAVTTAGGQQLPVTSQAAGAVSGAERWVRGFGH
jgi:hypothetical protein